MGNMRRAFIKSAPFWGDGLDVSIEGPNRAGVRLALQSALAATGAWQGAIYQLTRLYVTPITPLDPFDFARREQAAGLLCQTIAGEVDDTRSIHVLDWVFGHWLKDPKHRMVLSFSAWNPTRTLELETLRSPMLTPWLSGFRAVRNLEAFRGFHADLSSEERFAARLIVYWAHWGMGMPTALGGWFGSAGASLLAGGWVKIESRDGRSIFVPDRGLRRLALGQGELLEA